ncbi:hypothetical protein ERX27_05895 [Macrococcus brunensis]|uniref:Uncharacterized protein n=1 Tax=Macrococcus brunensis TaxID=198483 RepID=A0A4R6BE03_9STAP|nr:hypothetical protein [Macrococcus brunensis]TDL97992.1 hypothetical protein ERX27_05895 [Macrococcus brunensis]ULG74007.1 hypothetical protein MGG13_10220 [Macrococcus brunensis]
MAEEKYDVLDTEKEYLNQQGAEESAALVNDSLNVAPDAGVQELDPNPPTDKKMIEEDDK